MHPLSIILAFVSLGLMVILGVACIGFGTRKLWEQVHVSYSTRLGTAILSWHGFLVMLGLLLLAYGILGTYRIVWAT